MPALTVQLKHETHKVFAWVSLFERRDLESLRYRSLFHNLHFVG